MTDQLTADAAHRTGMTDPQHPRGRAERELQSILDAAGGGSVDAWWLKDKFEHAFPYMGFTIAPDPDAPQLAESLDEIPWFPAVLAKAKADLAATPEQAWPLWYRHYRALTDTSSPTDNEMEPTHG